MFVEKLKQNPAMQISDKHIEVVRASAPIHKHLCMVMYKAVQRTEEIMLSKRPKRALAFGLVI
jgi:hypothetical protein